MTEDFKMGKKSLNSKLKNFFSSTYIAWTSNVICNKMKVESGTYYGPFHKHDCLHRQHIEYTFQKNTVPFRQMEDELGVGHGRQGRVGNIPFGNCFPEGILMSCWHFNARTSKDTCDQSFPLVFFLPSLSNNDSVHSNQRQNCPLTWKGDI